MPNSGTVPASKSKRRIPLTWLSFLGAWAVIQVLVLTFGATPLLDGSLMGTDGYMRLVRVEVLHETGAWFDGRIALSNAPFGDTLHWTRPLDVLLLGAAWPLTPFLGFEKALFWGGAFVSPLLLLATGYAMLWASKPLVDAESRPFVVIVFLTQLGVLAARARLRHGRVGYHRRLRRPAGVARAAGVFVPLASRRAHRGRLRHHHRPQRRARHFV